MGAAVAREAAHTHLAFAPLIAALCGCRGAPPPPPPRETSSVIASMSTSCRLSTSLKELRREVLCALRRPRRRVTHGEQWGPGALTRASPCTVDRPASCAGEGAAGSGDYHATT